MNIFDDRQDGEESEEKEVNLSEVYELQKEAMNNTFGEHSYKTYSLADIAQRLGLTLEEASKINNDTVDIIFNELQKEAEKSPSATEGDTLDIIGKIFEDKKDALKCFVAFNAITMLAVVNRDSEIKNAASARHPYYIQ